MINSPATSQSGHKGFWSYPVITVLTLAALLAVPLVIVSALSPSRFTIVDENVEGPKPPEYNGAFMLQNFNLVSPLPQASTVSLETFAGNCTTPKSVFNVQDPDLIVCAKFTNAVPGWKLIWSNANFVAVQSTTITTQDGTATFTLNANSSLGGWRVILYEPFGGTVQAVTRFTVVDAQNPTADVSVSKGLISSSASPGNQVVYSIEVTNYGPSDAATVVLGDSVPANTTFYSFGQLGGPTFNCNSPNQGETGTTTCTLTNMMRGESAVFIATYLIDTVANGTIISNTTSVTSTTPDQHDGNNSSSAAITVTNAPCQLSTPANITVSADTGQAGAAVSYSNPTGTGDCGTTVIGENGETIPAIACNPASGSFFPVGTTTVLCSAQTGAAVSFLVTVDNPGALSISLVGSESLNLECGQRFSDPGATAIDASGQSLEVTVSYTNGFNPDAPTVGSYTATYTAISGANSVSATRAIVVADNEGPSITIGGANPYKIQTGSCLPFVDPGASAFDNCSGSETVSSSVLGPGGATSVFTNIPGTYIVTYTTTDGSHESSATRTVIVGTFPEDEVDQPGSSNIPPTLALNGDAQITVECGSGFTDPGATAELCGNPVTVTTTGSVNPNVPGVYSINYSASANGFTSEATRIVTVQDTVAPVITLNGANPMSVGFGSVFSDPGATASDACAGDLTSSIVVTGTVNTSTVGVYTLTYSVNDSSGQSDTRTRTVEVLPYNFSGFFPPIENPPIFNEMKAGQAAPVKFSLGSNQGLNIFAPGSPSSIAINCTSGVTVLPVEQTETAGNSSLSYDAVSNLYKYTWKTENSWKNTCRQLTVTLREGTVHTANFKFK